jgi:anti-anti-sigma factor
MINGQKNFKELNNTIVLYADNYINDTEGEKLEEICDDFLGKGIKNFIINFSGTELVNSIGISILIGIIEKIKDEKGVIVFSELNKINHSIFTVVGLTKHIRVSKTEDEALKLLENHRD